MICNRHNGAPSSATSAGRTAGLESRRAAADPFALEVSRPPESRNNANQGIPLQVDVRKSWTPSPSSLE